MPHTRESVLTEVWQAIAALPTPRPAPARDPELALLDGGLGLDSVELMELIAALEEQLGFQFHDADLRPGSFRTLGTLAEIVAARLGVVR